jgi:hypothetical protein
MQVVVDERGVTVRAPEEFTRFSVAQGDNVQLDAVLRALGWGWLDHDGDAFVAVDAIRRAVAGQVSDVWEDRFRQMLAFVATRGWVSADGHYVRAHVERVDR